MSAQLHSVSHTMTLGLHTCISITGRLLLSCNMLALAELSQSQDHPYLVVTLVINMLGRQKQYVS